jgi:hypothetical protein
MSAQPNIFEEPPLVPAEPNEEMFCAGDENSWQETHAADAVTVKTRERSSAFVASLNAVIRRSGIPEACRVRKLDLNLDEIKCLLLTCMDAAQQTEEKAKREDRPCGKVRRFKACAGVMEMYHKRLEMPPGLTKEEKAKWLKSKGRNWQRRFKRLHLAQCFTHLPFFVKYKGEASPEKLVAPSYVDNLTDLIADTARRARGKSGNPIQRYNKAADEALAHFRETMKPGYAPEWTLEEYTGEENAKSDAAATSKAKTDDPRESVKKAALNLVMEGKRVAQESGMSAEEEIAYRLEIQTEIETLWTSLPPDSPRPKANRASLDTPSPSPVIVNSDIHKKDDAAPAEKATNLSLLNTPEIQKHSAKTQNTPEIAPHFVAAPADEARLTVEAFESVGCDKFKAVFVGIYPLTGEAERFGSEPKQKGESITGAQIKLRLPQYIKRNRAQGHNVALRAWGAIIQVDDCTAQIMEHLKPFAFLITETSPGNYQVWLALPKPFIGADGKISAEGKALRTRLMKKFQENGEPANGGAYGSTRLPGTLNIKEKYQGSFPQIHVVYVAMGRIVTPEELEQAGLLADAPAVPALTLVESPRYSNSKLPTEWPDYQYYVSRAPAKEDGQPNLNSADESFVVRCLALGHPRYSVGAKLRSLRDKAANRADYVERTLDSAEAWLASQPAQNGRERATI